ncbi:MAG: esterase/lipase family protein [Acidiferrobacteraceae bacterium]
MDQSGRNRAGRACLRVSGLTQPVVLLPGLWTPGPAMGLLSWRLRRYGFASRVFDYQAVRRDLHENGAALEAYLKRRQDGQRVHLVGFSTGGLVIRAFAHDFGTSRIGRVVMMGTPNGGSVAARRFAVSRVGRALLGRSIGMLLAGVPAQWPWPDVELGLMAGSARPLSRNLASPDDGLVTIREVWLPGARDHIVLPVSHSAFLVSREAAGCVARFLRHGRFDAPSVGFEAGR